MRERIEADNIFCLEGTTGTFRLKKPKILSSCRHMAEMNRHSNPDFKSYQIIKLGIVKKYPCTKKDIFSPFFAVPNTEHTFYY